jgi:hypothetical protein
VVLVAALLATLALSGVSAAVPSQASASVNSGSVALSDPSQEVLRNVNTSRCLDDSRFGLRTIVCNGLSYQKFIQQNIPFGRFAMVDVATGLCVDDSIRFNLRSFPCNWLSYQQWRAF